MAEVKKPITLIEEEDVTPPEKLKAERLTEASGGGTSGGFGSFQPFGAPRPNAEPNVEPNVEKDKSSPS